MLSPNRRIGSYGMRNGSSDTYDSLVSFDGGGSSVSTTCTSVDVPLTDEMLGVLCRRGRRHLHELKESCQAILQVDKSRKVLKICASEDGIASVKEKLECLEGPRREVSRAVWAELMRTRTWEPGPDAALIQLQEASACRIHIERHEATVRLFGTRKTVEVADQLLTDFESKVCEKYVAVGEDMPDMSSLNALANSCGITLRAEADHIALLGLHANVERAIQELTQDVPALRIGSPVAAPKPSPIGQQALAMVEAEPRRPVQVRHSSQSVSCPTCGACPYCTRCGEPTNSRYAQPMPIEARGSGQQGRLYVPTAVMPMPLQQGQAINFQCGEGMMAYTRNEHDMSVPTFYVPVGMPSLQSHYFEQ